MKKKKKTIKRICPNCDHMEFYSWSDYLRIFVLFICASVTLLSVSLFMIAGPGSVLNFVLSSKLTSQAADHSTDLRLLALNYTTYSGNDPYIFARELISNLPEIRYVLDSRLTDPLGPEYLLEYGGDCKAMSILFSSMMLSVGHTAHVDCNANHNHCVVRIDYYGNDERYLDTYMMVDLTGSLLKVFPSNVDHWENETEYYQFEIY